MLLFFLVPKLAPQSSNEILFVYIMQRTKVGLKFVILASNQFGSWAFLPTILQRKGELPII